MQSDGRFVENVAGAHQSRSEAGGELDALRFAAGESGGQAIEREVVEADVVQKFEALADLDQDLVGDGGLFGRQLERLEELVGLGDVELHEFGDGSSGDADIEGVLAQARRPAIGALGVAAIAAEEHAHVDLVFFGFDFVEEVADAVADGGLFFGGEIAEGNVPAHLGARGFAEVRSEPLVLRFGPGLDGALLERQGGVGNDQVEVVVDGVAETLAARASAHGVVEAE